MPQCNAGHALREVSRVRRRETVEDVVYMMKKIKKFNREGSETIEEVRMPEFVERQVEVDVVEYACDACGTTQSARENEVTL